MSVKRVAVVGASGFVGSAVLQALQAAGHDAVPVKAPRLPPVTSDSAPGAGQARHVAKLVRQFSACAAVINAAGNPDASSVNEPSLNAANAALVGLLASAARQTPSRPRFVHVSSAVVQGRAPVLDDAPGDAQFSAYARSKVLGERLALELGPEQTTVYRPPSVHAADRRVSQMIGRIASSPLAIVAGPGTQPTPQALIANVASAIAFLATCDEQPPRIVAHPSEGVTVASLMEALGGRPPRKIPRRMALIAAWGLEWLGRHLDPMAANSRRAEIILFGQPQAPSWLSHAGWAPAVGPDGWHALGRELIAEQARAARGAG